MQEDARELSAELSPPCALVHPGALLQELGELQLHIPRARLLGSHRIDNGCRAYHCINCNFFLHKSCVELPPEIQHPSHPQYPLALISSEEGYRNCSGCHDDIFRGYRYQCDGCQVALHVGCAAATLPTSKEEHQDEQEHKEEIIQHFAREHPLASFHVNAQLQSMRMPDLRLRLWLPCLHIRAAQIMRPDALRDNESSSPSTAPAHLA
ncbi:hypothetical protein CDL15_Pgr000770 [Punica granatum]|uniref:DC1 domain-containing protein n=1 Tax=Punica granatum TaxID=22663 RepID=A0A218W4C7_PUNGR|nr:hypothetical protein CDL15_Pgr000770 [Punica granatum]